MLYTIKQVFDQNLLLDMKGRVHELVPAMLLQGSLETLAWEVDLLDLYFKNAFQFWKSISSTHNHLGKWNNLQQR